jgi:alkaline phosphatase D
LFQVETQNLKPYTTYYYQFSVCGSSNKSPIGRTKTTPNADDDVTKVSLAIYSCSNFPFGFFNAYGNTVRKASRYLYCFCAKHSLIHFQDSVDYVVHLGDYIYEYKNGDYGWGDSIGRISLPNKEILSLYDYRKRIATYRTDLDLLASHQQFPWIPVWDDHEVADNSYKDGTFLGLEWLAASS